MAFEQKKIEDFLLTQTVWIFMVVLLAAATIQTSIYPPHGWKQYLGYLLVSGLLFAPVLIMVGNRTGLQQRLRPWAYCGVWIFVMAGNPIAVAWSGQTWLAPYLHTPSDGEALGVTGGLFFLLGLLLEVFPWVRRMIKSTPWLLRISLEKAFLIALIALALFLGLVLTAELEPDKNTGPWFGLHYLPVFFSFAGQLLIAFMAAYLLYLINHHFLVTRLLKRGGIPFYVAGLLGTVMLFYPILSQLVLWLPLNRHHQLMAPGGTMGPFAPENGMIVFMIMVISLPIILAVEWSRQNHRILALERQQVQTELDLLKQQLNPHFFFNTLNNLYALSRRKSDQTPEVIMQLSELMRYVIYKGREPWVQLEDEIKYISDYVQLQQIRLHKQLDFRLTDLANDEKALVPPLLLITFVENAFKHGIEPAENGGFLHIDIETTQSFLVFRCENSYEPRAHKPRGIGLENLQRRLQLIYGEAYRFEQFENIGTFRIELILPLA